MNGHILVFIILIIISINNLPAEGKKGAIYVKFNSNELEEFDEVLSRAEVTLIPGQKIYKPNPKGYLVISEVDAGVLTIIVKPGLHCKKLIIQDIFVSNDSISLVPVPFIPIQEESLQVSTHLFIWKDYRDGQLLKIPNHGLEPTACIQGTFRQSMDITGVYISDVWSSKIDSVSFCIADILPGIYSVGIGNFFGRSGRVRNIRVSEDSVSIVNNLELGDDPNQTSVFKSYVFKPYDVAWEGVILRGKCQKIK